MGPAATFRAELITRKGVIGPTLKPRKVLGASLRSSFSDGHRNPSFEVEWYRFLLDGHAVSKGQATDTRMPRCRSGAVVDA